MNGAEITDVGIFEKGRGCRYVSYMASDQAPEVRIWFYDGILTVFVTRSSKRYMWIMILLLSKMIPNVPIIRNVR